MADVCATTLAWAKGDIRRRTRCKTAGQTIASWCCCRNPRATKVFVHERGLTTTCRYFTKLNDCKINLCGWGTAQVVRHVVAHRVLLAGSMIQHSKRAASTTTCLRIHLNMSVHVPNVAAGSMRPGILISDQQQ